MNKANFGTFNLQSLGMALAIAWLSALLWSPSILSTYYIESGRDLDVHVLRFLLLAAVSVVYVIARFRPKVFSGGKASKVVVIVGVILSPLPLIGSCMPELYETCSFYGMLDGVFWVCGGFSVSIMMLVWGYWLDTKKAYGQGVINVSVGAMLSGALFVLLSLLQRPIAAVLTMSLPFILLVLWLICLRLQGEETEDSATTIRLALGKSTPLFVFSYGLIMGLAGAVGTQFELAAWTPVFVGASSVVAGIVTLVLARLGYLHVGRATFVFFAPCAVTCLFLLSLADGIGKVILLSVVFLVVNVCNVLNTAYGSNDIAAMAGDVSVSDKHKATKQVNPTHGVTAAAYAAYRRFTEESRVSDMVGSTLGWAMGTAIQFVIVDQWEPYWYFLIAVALVGLATSTFRVGGVSSKMLYASAATWSDMREMWQAGCARLAQQYGLSAREEEVFALLARGRDRQYIHETLDISLSTVRSHAYNLYKKLGVHDQQQLIDLVENELSQS